MQDIEEAKTWLLPLLPVLSLVQRCVKVFSLDTSVNTRSSRQNIHFSLVYFQDTRPRKVSSSVSRVKSFWGQQGQAGRQAGQGVFWWTRGLTVELSLEYLFPPTCWLLVWLKILCTSFFCLCSLMLSTILYSLLSFPPSNISCQSFLRVFNLPHPVKISIGNKEKMSK